MTEQVVYEPNARRFAIYLDGAEAGFAEFREAEGVRDFNHTVVHPDFRGQGISKKVIAKALADTEEAGLRIKATCSAVAHFVEQHPEYQAKAIIPE